MMRIRRVKIKEDKNQRGDLRPNLESSNEFVSLKNSLARSTTLLIFHVQAKTRQLAGTRLARTDTDTRLCRGSYTPSYDTVQIDPTLLHDDSVDLYV